MSARVDVEEIRTTASEKLLAAVLAVFVLLGALWTYVKIDDYVRDAVSADLAGSTQDRAAIRERSLARDRLSTAERAQATALADLELAREAYRTALDEGRRAPRLAGAYRSAQADHIAAGRLVEAAERRAEAAEPAAAAAETSIAGQLERREDRRALVSFALRSLLFSLVLGAGLWLLARLRRGGSRYFPLGGSIVVAGAILAVVLATDYVTDYVDPLDLGPLVLSIAGAAMTLAAFAVLQRWLARRLPLRRTRNRECPFCGYPVRENAHCERCGRAVLAECTACGGGRRVGTLRCGACGSA